MSERELQVSTKDVSLLRQRCFDVLDRKQRGWASLAAAASSVYGNHTHDAHMFVAVSCSHRPYRAQIASLDDTYLSIQASTSAEHRRGVRNHKETTNDASARCVTGVPVEITTLNSVSERVSAHPHASSKHEKGQRSTSAEA